VLDSFGVSKVVFIINNLVVAIELVLSVVLDIEITLALKGA